MNKPLDDQATEFRCVKDAMKKLSSWDDYEVRKLCQVIFPYMTEHYRKSVSLGGECAKLEAARDKLEKQIEAYVSVCKQQDAEIARLHIAYSVGKERR